jgi:hypothetical protein
VRQIKQRGPLGTLGIWGAAVAVGTLVATAAVVPAQAAPPDVTEAEGLFLSGSGIVDVDTLAELRGAYSAYSGTATTPVANPLDLTALQALTLTGDIALFGDNPLLELGATSQYGAATPTGSTAASGLITESGAIQVGDGSPAQQASLDLARFLSAAQIAALADELSLELGAVSSTATATRTVDGYTATSDYQVDGARLELHSPAVAALSADLNETISDLDVELDTATAGLPTLVEGAVVTPLQQTLAVLGDTVQLQNTTATVTAEVDLATVTAPVLAAPLVNGPVSVDLSTGDVVVDIEELQTLNDLDPNTELLTGPAVAAELQAAIAGIFDETLPDALDAAVTGALDTTAATVVVTTTPAVTVSVP